MAELYLDLTELLNNPIRTGIQRVEGELVQWWPAGTPYRIVRFDPTRGLVVLPDETASCVRRIFTSADAERDELLDGLRTILGSTDHPVLDVKHEATRLVVPELFYEGGRIAFYSSLTQPEIERTFFLVYDLLPLTHPAYFEPMLRPELTCAYFRMIRLAKQIGFISRATRRTFHERLRRSPDVAGPAFYLGSDGLGPRPPERAKPAVPLFTVVGTIEPRKNHAPILEAFRRFRMERPDAELRFYGNLGWCAPELRSAIAAENGKNGFQFVENPSDVAIREAVIGSTATIYASAAEGFGLPPVESLWLGTPVVAPRHIPSLESLQGGGVFYLDTIDPECVLAAMRTVSGDASNAELREGARRLSLPTWESFAREFCGWVRG